MQATGAGAMCAGYGQAVAVFLPPCAAVVLVIYIENRNAAGLAGADANKHKAEFSVHRLDAGRVSAGG
jgi:hypothetical protein